MLAVDFEELAYPYIIIGRDLTVKLVNKPFASLFGESVEDLMNKRIDKLQLSANLAGRFVTKFPILVNMAEEMYDKEDPSKAIIPFKSMPFSTAIADGKEFEGLINCKADFDEKGRLVSLLLWGTSQWQSWPWTRTPIQATLDASQEHTGPFQGLRATAC